MRKQINKWFGHPLILQSWKEAKVQNLSYTDKCNWAEFSVFASDGNECRLELEGRPYLLCRYFNETSLPWRLGTLSKILSISETKVFTSTEFKNISTHLSPFFPLSPPLVWICILYGMWPGQQKKVGVAAAQKFEPIPRFGDFRSILLGTSIDPEKRKLVLYRGWTLDRERCEVFIYDLLLHCQRCSLSPAVSDHKSLPQICYFMFVTSTTLQHF